MLDLQQRISATVRDVFGSDAMVDEIERAKRFLEEATEAAAVCGVTKEETLAIIYYVYNRPQTDPYREIAQAQLTLFALAEAMEVDVIAAAECELIRLEAHGPEIREKARLKKKKAGLL